MLEVKYSKVIKRKDGRYSAYAWTEDSPRKYAYGKTSSECRKHLSEIISNLEKGIVTDYSIMSDFTENWFSVRCANLSPSTKRGYASYLKNHVIPFLGDKQVNKITHADCQALISTFNAAHSEKSTKLLLGLLHTIFEYARHNQIIAANPAEGISISPTQEYEYYIYTPEEMQTLLSAIKGTEDEVPVMLAAFCGLRMSEVMGLRWEDIDFDDNTLKIRQVALSWGKEVIIKNVPKTKSSAKPIALPEPVIAVLQQNRQDSGFVVGKNGLYFTHHFTRVLQHLGLPKTRFHDLRHFVATSLMDAGLPEKAITEYLRHSDTGITKHYEHIRANRKTQAADTMSLILGGVKSGVNDKKNCGKSGA